MEIGAGVGGSARACNLQTKASSTLVGEVPILTTSTYRGNALWGSTQAFIPALADVGQLAP